MTSTEAPEGVAVLTDRAGVTGKTARKSASFALKVTAAGLSLPQPASSPAPSAKRSTSTLPLVTPGDYDNLPGAPRRPRRKSGPDIRRPPSGWTSSRATTPSPVTTTIEPPAPLPNDPGSPSGFHGGSPDASGPSPGRARHTLRRRPSRMVHAPGRGLKARTRSTIEALGWLQSIRASSGITFPA